MAPVREQCKVCHHPNPVGFWVPDSVWERVVPAQFSTHVVCLSCFTRFADERLVQWDADIRFYPVSLLTHITEGAVDHQDVKDALGKHD